VIISQLNQKRIPITPLEANPVLIINANAELAVPVTTQFLQPISGWKLQVIQTARRVQHQEFSLRHARWR
jgi:hypothetical protein